VAADRIAGDLVVASIIEAAATTDTIMITILEEMILRVETLGVALAITITVVSAEYLSVFYHYCRDQQIESRYTT
jgi:hypothetical protein